MLKIGNIDFVTNFQYLRVDLPNHSNELTQVIETLHSDSKKTTQENLSQSSNESLHGCVSKFTELCVFEKTALDANKSNFEKYAFDWDFYVIAIDRQLYGK